MRTFTYHSGLLVEINQVPHRFLSQTIDGGWSLINLRTNEAETKTLDSLDALYSSSSLRLALPPDAGWDGSILAAKRQKRHHVLFSELPLRDQRRISDRTDWPQPCAASRTRRSAPGLCRRCMGYIRAPRSYQRDQRSTCQRSAITRLCSFVSGTSSLRPFIRNCCRIRYCRCIARTRSPRKRQLACGNPLTIGFGGSQSLRDCDLTGGRSNAHDMVVDIGRGPQ
jgi:hypothetical protein